MYNLYLVRADGEMQLIYGSKDQEKMERIYESNKACMDLFNKSIFKEQPITQEDMFLLQKD